MSSLTTLLVLSRKSVSLGDSLWKTTFEMEDLPLLISMEQGIRTDRDRGKEGKREK